MGLRQFALRGKSSAEEADAINTERCLTLMAEGTAMHMPEIDPEAYEAFRGRVSRLSLQLRDRLPEDDQLALVRTILREFELYRDVCETTLRERTMAWRNLVNQFFSDLVANIGSNPHSAPVSDLRRAIPALSSTLDIDDWHKRAVAFLHPPDVPGQPQGSASIRKTNRSTTNDNATGLLGGGSAVEHVKTILDRGGDGFVALFRLSCLEMIHQRFGDGAVEDAVMAVSAYLTANLQREDTMFHWSNSSLLAVLTGRANEKILMAELQRIVWQSCESTIFVRGRNIMLRIPVNFELTPLNRLNTAEDLYRLSLQPASRCL